MPIRARDLPTPFFKHLLGWGLRAVLAHLRAVPAPLVQLTPLLGLGLRAAPARLRAVPAPGLGPKP